MGRFRVLFPALPPLSRRVIAEPKLLLQWVQRVCALAAHARQIICTALVSACTLTDTLFAPLLPFLFFTRTVHLNVGGFTASATSAA